MANIERKNRWASKEEARLYQARVEKQKAQKGLKYWSAEDFLNPKGKKG